MRIFDLVDFAQNEHLTLRLKLKGAAIKTFGDLAVSYLIIPGGGGNCRLLVKLVVNHPPNLKGRLMRRFLPWGDLVMMRKQLLNLKRSQGGWQRGCCLGFGWELKLLKEWRLRLGLDCG